MSDVWNRYTELQIGSVLIANDTLDIEFVIEGGNTPDANTAEIAVWNLSRATRAKIRADDLVFIRAGYMGDYGTIFTGRVESIETEIDGADVRTIIQTTNQVYAADMVPEEHKYPPGTPLSTIIYDAFTASDIPVERIDDQGYVIQADYTCSPSAEANLVWCQQQINGDPAREPQATFYVEEGKGYFVTTSYAKEKEEAIVISSATGLIETAEEESDEGECDRTIKCLLQWKVTADAYIALVARVGTGTYKVVSYTHTCSGSDYYSELKVKAL